MRLITTANIIVSVCILKFLTSLSKLIVMDDKRYAIYFAFGCTVFELVALIMWSKREDIKGTWKENFLYFCIGCALFMLWKITFTDPFTFTNTEYMELGAGFIIMILQNVYVRIFKSVV